MPIAVRLSTSTASFLALVVLLLPAVVTLTSPEVATAAERCSRGVGPVRSAPGTGKTVALTFDDGPTKFTPQVLRILRRNDVRATFFVTGRHAEAKPKILAQVAAEGHLIAGHTYDHDYPSQVRGGWTRSYIADQFDRSNRVLSSATDRAICFFRPPGGYQTSGMYDAARARGTAVVLWSIDTEDWKQPGRTTPAATRRIVGRAKAGGSQPHPLILFHDGKASHEPESQVSSNRSNTVAALPKVIAYYRSHGYRFVDLTGASGLPAETTTVSVSAAPDRVPAGTRSVLTGGAAATTGPVAGREVIWFARPSGAGAWQRRGTVTTGTTGRFRLTVEPSTDTDYQVRLPGSPRYRASSGSTTVRTYTHVTDEHVAGPASVPAGARSSGGAATDPREAPRRQHEVVDPLVGHDVVPGHAGEGD